MGQVKRAPVFMVLKPDLHSHNASVGFAFKDHDLGSLRSLVLAGANLRLMMFGINTPSYLRYLLHPLYLIQGK